jgi:cation-transporting ATPase E
MGLAGTAAGQSAAIITLALLASWILVTASRPLTWTKGLILAGMYAGLFLLFTVPPATEFLRLEWPPPDLLAVSAATGMAGSAAVQAFAALQRTRQPEKDRSGSPGRR